MRTYLLCAVLAVGCVDTGEPEDGRDDSFLVDGKADTGGIDEGSPEAAGVLAVANGLTKTKLHDDVGLSTSAATNIAAHTGTFATLAELDDVPYVGSVAFHKLLIYAKANGFVSGGTTTVGHGTLLDCNTSVGPDQQVTVIGNGTTLTLRELTTSGSQQDRNLSVAEWSSKKLSLRSDGFGSKSVLAKSGGTWSLSSTGGGINEFADADCWTDKSN